MKLQIAELTTDRQWSATTGFTSGQFTKLLSCFTQSYFELHGKTVTQRHADLAVTPTFTSESELLFFTLFSLKAGLTYDVLGFVCGLDIANAKRNQELGLKVLEHTLAAAGCLPRRTFKKAADFKKYLRLEPLLIFDGLEQRMQRPHQDDVQRDFYSGKKMPYRQSSHLE